MEWSTENIRPSERFSYWREAVCHSIFNLTIDAPPGEFAARMIARSAGPIRVALSESTAYQVVRDKREVGRAASDSYSVYLQLHGEAVISQNGQAFAFRAGDIAISDLQHPFVATLSGAARRITSVIPCEMLDRRAPWVRKTALRRVPADSAYVDLARRHIVELLENPRMSESAASLLTENLCNLLALASATDLAPHRMPSELQIEAMLAFCRRKLDDSELSPQRVAEHLGVSVRTLQSRFRQIGQTFAEWVRDERLKACSAALRDPTQRGLHISEIAYRWGFGDLSHFNRSFRKRFDRTPKQWRNES
jgi:AraC family transcriptional regulator, positive regulator of tynA and feaB